ncbi:MAG: translin [Archaeoglobaceae archaeon]
MPFVAMNLESCRKKLEELEKAREELLILLRDLRILSSKAIIAIHSSRIEEAEENLKKASTLLKKIKEFQEFPEIYAAHDSMQEFVEAMFLLKIVKKEFNFSLDFEVLESAFVTGLADLVGELRRLALSKMIRGEIAEAENLLSTMERIYNELIPFASFPDKLVPNLRAKLDVARVALERTKSDLIVAKLYAVLDRDR